jgi:hypothetical protein
MDIKGQEELYKLLNTNKLYTKSFDEFKSQFSNPESQSKLYDGLVQKGIYKKPQKDFTNQFFGVEKKNPIQTGGTKEATVSQPPLAKPKSSSAGGMLQMATPSESELPRPKAGESQGKLLIPEKKEPIPSLKKFDVTAPQWFNPNKPIKIDVPTVTKNVATASKELAQQSKLLSQTKAQLEAEVKSFEDLYSANPQNPNLNKLKQELDKKIEAQNALSNKFQLDINNVNRDRADIKKAAVQKFIDDKEKGNFLGATWNSIVEGYKKIGEAQSRVAIDFGIELMDRLGKPYADPKIIAKKGMTKDEAKKEVISQMMPIISKGYDVAKSKGTTEAYIQQQKSSGVLPKAWFGVAESLPVMASGPGLGGTIPRFVSGASLAYQYANDELDSNPNTVNMDENERKKITVPIAVIGGVLEELGFRTLIGKNKPALVKLSSYILKQLPKNATIETIKEAASLAVKGPIMKQIVSSGTKLGTAYLGEAETGGSQRALDYATKEIYDAANNVDLFKNPELLSAQFRDQIIEDANIEGLGGVMMRAIGIGSSAAMSVAGVGQMSDKEFKAWKDLTSVAESGQLYLSKVVADLSTGRIDVTEASQRIADFQAAKKIADQIPNDLSIADQKKAFAILRENAGIEAGIKDLQKYIAGKNPNLVSNINKQIEDLQKRIEDNNNQLTKLSENAVQEQTTSEVPIQPEAGAGDQVAEGEPQAEPQVPAEEGQGQEVAPSGGGMVQMAETEQPTPEEPVVEQPVAEEPVVEQPVAEEPSAEEIAPEEKPTEMSEKEWNNLQNLANRIANGEEIDSEEDSNLQDKYPTTLNSLVAKKISELPKQEAPEPTTSLSTGQKNAIKEGIKRALDMVKRYPKQDDLLTKYRALKEFKKTNQEYIDANQSQKDGMIRKMNVELGLAPKVSAPSAQSIVGPKPTMTLVDQAKALRDQLLLEEKAAESGKEFINNARKIVIDAIKNRTKGALSPKATKALLNALGGKIDTPKQRAEVISKVIDIFKKSEDVVAVKESIMRNEKIKLIDQAIKKGQTNFKKAVKDLAADIKAMLPKGVFSPAQLKIVANALASNVLNPKLRQAAIDRVNRMVNNVIEANKLKEAYDLRKKIRKADTENLAGELQDIAKGFAQIDPRYIDDLDKHLEQARQVYDAVKGVKVKEAEEGGKQVEPRAIIDYASTQDYTQKQLDKQEEIMKDALLQQYADLVAEGKLDEGMSLAQIQAYVRSLAEDPTANNEEKDQALRDFAQESFDESKQELEDSIEDGTLDEDDIPLIEGFTKMDLSIMSPMQAYEAAEALMNYRVNGSTSKMGKVLANYVGALGVKTITESIGRDGKVNVGGTRYLRYKALGKALDKLVQVVSFGKMKTNLSEKLSSAYSDLWLEYNATLDNLGTTYFGPNNWATIKDAAGLNDIIKGVVQRKVIIEQFRKEIHDKYKDKKIGKDNVFTAKNANLLGIIANLYRQTSDVKKQDAYFNDRKKILKEFIDYLNSSENEDEQKQGQLLGEIYNELGIENATSGQEVFDNADPVAQDIINDFINKFKEYYPTFSKIAQEQFNIILGQDNNYTSDSWRTVGKEAKSSSDKLFSKNGFRTNMDIIDTEATGRFTKPKYPSTLPKRNGKVSRVPSYDFFQNNMDALAETINTVKTINGINQYVGFVDSPDFNKLITDEASRNFFKDRVDYNVSLFKMDEKIGRRKGYTKNIVDFFKIPTTLGTSVGLSSAQAVLTQSLPILTNTAINLRNPLYLLAATQYVGNKDMRDFLNNLDYGITERGSSAQTSIDYADNMLERGDYSTAEKTLETLKKASRFWVEKVLVGTDVLTAKTTWMAYYMDELAKEGVDPMSINWANHEVNEKAAKYAERMVEREQNLNLAEAGGKLWSSKDSRVRIARMTMPFASFTTNQKDKIKTNMAVLFMDNNLATKEEKIAAAKSLVASFGEQYVFNGIKALITGGIATGAYNILRKKETEEEKKIREQKLAYQKIADIYEAFNGSVDFLEKESSAIINNFLLRATENLYNVFDDAVEKKLTRSQIIKEITKINWGSDKQEEKKIQKYPFAEAAMPKTQSQLKKEKLKKDLKKPFRFYESQEAPKTETVARLFGGTPLVAYDTWVKFVSQDLPDIVSGSTKTADDKEAKFTKEEAGKLLFAIPVKVGAGFAIFPRELKNLSDQGSKIIKESANMRYKRTKAEQKRMMSEMNN